jgi:hypothetical protein
MSGLSLFGSGLTITEGDGPTAYLGTWNASTNTPTLVSSTAPAGPGGSYYIVSVAGTTNLNGITDWTVGDWVIWSGSVWQKLEGGMTSVTVGSTQIAGGTSGRVLYDNAGVLGEMTNTGTGTVSVLQTSPALITPALGVATGTSLALGGATIGTNALAVTGTTLFTGNVNSTGYTNTSTSFQAAAAGQIYFSGRSSIQSSVNGKMLLGSNTPSLAADFHLQFQGTTSAGAEIKVAGNTSTVKFRLADDSADAPITAAAATFSGAVTVPGVTTAALTSTGTFTSGAGAQVGTLTNAPAAGNPTTWIKIVDNGTTRYIPAW